MSTLIVPGRFCGPPVSGNGGWTAGELAAHVEHGCPHDHADAWPAVQVTLRRPPPLDTEMQVRTAAGATELTDGEHVVADALIVESVPDPVPLVGYDVARQAEASFGGHRVHPFPGCFSCGPERAEGDGLRIFPGEVSPVGDRRRVAATWTPHPSLAEDWHHYSGDDARTSLAVAWAALDCVGGWAEDLTTRPMVLGRMTARIDRLPRVAEPHVVVGQHLAEQGRRTFTASSLYDSAGQLVAVAGHVWFHVDPTEYTHAAPARS